MATHYTLNVHANNADTITLEALCETRYPGTTMLKIDDLCVFLDDAALSRLARAVSDRMNERFAAMKAALPVQVAA